MQNALKVSKVYYRHIQFCFSDAEYKALLKSCELNIHPPNILITYKFHQLKVSLKPNFELHIKLKCNKQVNLFLSNYQSFISQQFEINKAIKKTYQCQMGHHNAFEIWMHTINAGSAIKGVKTHSRQFLCIWYFLI